MAGRARAPRPPLEQALGVKLVLHAGALADLEAAGDWYEAQQPGLGEDFAAEVADALDVIRENPMTWPLWPGSPKDLQVRRFLRGFRSGLRI